MTNDELQQLRALCEAASPADRWKAKGYGFGVGFCHGFQDDVTEHQRDTGIHNAAFIAAARTALPALIDRVEELERERDEARNRVLRPLTEREVQAALHEGRAEAMAATGDNAWTSLLAARDKLAAECERLRALVNRAADSLDYCVQRHGEYNKSVRGDELRAAAKEGLT